MALDFSHKWSLSDVRALETFYGRGASLKETATYLGRNEDEVCAKAQELGLVEIPRTWVDPRQLQLFPKDIAAS
jgi:hypothetical protein